MSDTAYSVVTPRPWSRRIAMAIVVLYALTLVLFATVHELQFWDYAD